MKRQATIGAISFVRSHPYLTALCLLLSASFILFWFSLPDPLFDEPYSTVLQDRQGNLLGAKIATDGQWRFPPGNAVPIKYRRALLEFEDQRFYSHPGVDPLAIARALKQNIKAGRVVSGGSTLTMQVIRLSKDNPPRTVWEKIKEAFLAVRLELAYSKDEILALYAAHAPFGGNVVGLEAASWRYFGRPPSLLSWAESATLAVLPNSPAIIHPDRNRSKLKRKRDRLLDRLHLSHAIDSLTTALAKSEPLPGKTIPLPQEAPHLLNRFYTGSYHGSQVRSTLDRGLQRRVQKVVDRHHQMLKRNQIHNAAALILDVETGEVLSYIGNTENNATEHGSDVDIIAAPRSTGSILKPALYTLMLNEGSLLPDMLVPDIPTQISDYAPKNFSLSYDGAVPASEAIARSLNVPSVRMLREYGVPKFHHYLQKLGITTLYHPPEHYGLSLILGGAEGTLWDITEMYGSFAHFMNRYRSNVPQTKSYSGLKMSLILDGDSQSGASKKSDTFHLNPGAVWSMLQAMVNVKRPDTEINWRQFSSSRKVAWKTGTSFGFRDGWAVGITPEYVIGVWVGNADGEGRPGLVGIETAGPILFDLFGLVGETSWFREPFYAMQKIGICRKSGHRAGPFCEPIDTVAVQKPGLQTAACPYHQLVHLNSSGTHRVNSRCMPVSDIRTESRFVLPPSQEWFYRMNHPSYQTLPPYLASCRNTAEAIAAMELIYPINSSKIYVPKELDGSPGNTVFEVAHRSAKATIFWHVDEVFVGKTRETHQMALNPKPGPHILTLVDENGTTLQHRFEILER
ncbi:MAG: penicillin-binding protein 1C [Balneolaceae bacterium]|nr:penicillin-binding protein 1C [Balneolaceae bacterium]